MIVVTFIIVCYLPHVVQKNIVDLSRLSQLAQGGFSEFANSTN